ncbi:MAG: 50S ribosomal protein L15 [Elusimicrobia bacterium]|nr:50S ribosomal protein L15 [Elusimicrobiota bacterium]
MDVTTTPRLRSGQAISLASLHPAVGATHRRKIVGRGEGSGHGGSATRGTKGQRARSGATRMVGFEGGQTPLLRRLPKRGFRNGPFRRRYTVIHVESLGKAFGPGQVVDEAALRERGMVKRSLPVKVLDAGVSELSHALVVRVSACSAQARAKIQASGGTVETPC